MLLPAEQRAAFALVLHAALADGGKTDAERAAVRRITESFAATPGAAFNPWVLYQEVLGGRYPLAQAAAELGRPEARLLAYEMALGVCETDGPPNPAERAFLHGLRAALHLDGASAAAESAAARVAAAVPGGAGPAALPVAVGAPPSASGSSGANANGAPPPTLVPVDVAALERSILHYAILNGALELLPQSIATMAIVPLQMKMVYAIGKAHGYTLDRGHLRDFLATAGAGLAAQAVEGYARKMLGGAVGALLGGGLLGGLGRAAVGSATGSALTFAATYAIGHLALRYYGGGRRVEAAVLKDTYQRLLADGRHLFGRHREDVARRAATLSPGEVINLVRAP